MAKDGSIYLLSRQINGDKGEVFVQNVTVFATSQTHAKALVNEQFTRLRRISNWQRAGVPGAARVRGRQGHARPAQDDHRGHHLLVTMNIATHAARKLARRSSRRQFFKLLGAGSLGAGLFLTRTDVSLGAITGCVGCGGGPCNPCFSPAGRCNDVTGGRLPVQVLRGRRRLPRRLQHGRRVVLLPHERGARRLPLPLLGVQLPGRLRQPVLPLLHGPPDAVPAAAALGRPAVHLRGGRRAGGRLGSLAA